MPDTIRLTAADGHQLAAYRASAADASAGLVVIQEIFGVNRHMRAVCDAFAAEGYAAVAPALFDRVEPGVELGYGPADIERGKALRGRLDDAAVLLDVAAAAASLGGLRAGIVGYCFGGTVAWWGATRTPLFAAAVSWYGGGIAGTRSERPNCPVQMHFGGRDQSIPISDVEAIRAAQPDAEVFIYPEAQHGFGCEERSAFSPVDYGQAQSRTLAFFAEHLRNAVRED
ncbi:MAG: dienelactone hydrolase family protein [Acetobacteraceae bacterium]|nr:dienelactone hydrolase family protein [Acetobacteraceae bacterium]